MAGGRPPFEITQKVIDAAEKHASRGLTKEQIALALGIAPSTLHVKIKGYPEFKAAIKKGEASGIAQVANALFERAMGCKTVEEKMVKRDGEDVVVAVEKQWPPDTTAGIFYLKNRAYNEWRDRKEVGIEDTRSKPIEMTDEQIELRRQELVGDSAQTTH